MPSGLVHKELHEQKLDAAYAERNQVVALVARMALAMGMCAGIRKTASAGWEPEWHNCVFIDLPTGQVSWHYHDREIPIFAGLPHYNAPWDGHGTPTKYERVNGCTRAEIGLQLRAGEDPDA